MPKDMNAAALDNSLPARVKITGTGTLLDGTYATVIAFVHPTTGQIIAPGALDQTTPGTTNATTLVDTTGTPIGTAANAQVVQQGNLQSNLDAVAIGDPTTPTNKATVDGSGNLQVSATFQSGTVAQSTLQGGLSRGRDSVSAHPHGHSYLNIAAAATAVILSAVPVVLHSIVCNTPVASASLTIYDSASGANNQCTKIALPATLLAEGPVGAIYDMALTNGLSITTVGTADWTITYDLATV